MPHWTYVVLSDPSNTTHHQMSSVLEPAIHFFLALLTVTRKAQSTLKGHLSNANLDSLVSDRLFSSAKQVEVGLPVCSDELASSSLTLFFFLYFFFFGFGSPSVFVYRGNKPANSPKGQPPDADGHSSVTDLANSLTGDMVMVRPSLPLPHPPHRSPLNPAETLQTPLSTFFFSAL